MNYSSVVMFGPVNFNFHFKDCFLFQDKGHSDTVNDLCWDEDQGLLYSCSNDHHVIQWDVSTASIRQ
jgi:WD40 repeat protein